MYDEIAVVDQNPASLPASLLAGFTVAVFFQFHGYIVGDCGQLPGVVPCRYHEIIGDVIAQGTQVQYDDILGLLVVGYPGAKRGSLVGRDIPVLFFR